MFSAAQSAHAGSSTWSENPTNRDWNTAANWSPATVPNAPADTATFQTSSLMDISLSASTTLNGATFGSGSGDFAITVPPNLTLSFLRTGVTNNSGGAPTFVTTVNAAGERGIVKFSNSTTVGAGVTFINHPSPVVLAFAAETNFDTKSSAGQGIFVNLGGLFEGTFGGVTTFISHSTAANGKFTNEAGAISGAHGGTTFLFDESDGGDAVFTSLGASVSGAFGGNTTITDWATAGNSTLIAEGGINGGGGGQISIISSSVGGFARVNLSGNGYMDITYHNPPGVTIGSIEGDGQIFLGFNKLSVGSNALSTVFTGVIGDGTNETGGSLEKVGAGTLTLTGANAYTSGTTVSAGILRVDNKNGSATGPGSVQVSVGTFGGKGIVAGAVAIGTASGTGAFLAPSVGASQPGKLTIQNTVTFKSDSTYTYRLNTKKAKADQVVAHGVTIESGAQFKFTAVANKTLTTGTAFTAISNTAATPISGAFVNLADGSTFTAGRNNFQVNYSGGNGNDLTLTVVP